MLRHFAVITVATTACLAMFATGENRGVQVQKAQAAGKGGTASAMSGGAEGLAQKGARNDKPVKLVNGITISSRTRLEGRPASFEDTEPERNEPPMSGDLRNIYPDAPQAQTARSPAGDPANGAVAMIEDPSGVPAPAAAAALSKRPTPGKPHQPRRATQLDYERMMADSERRSGTASIEE